MDFVSEAEQHDVQRVSTWEREIGMLDQKEMECQQTQLRVLVDLTSSFTSELASLRLEVESLKSLHAMRATSNAFCDHAAPADLADDLSALRTQVRGLEINLSSCVRELSAKLGRHDAEVRSQLATRDGHQASMTARMRHVENFLAASGGEMVGLHTEDARLALETVHRSPHVAPVGQEPDCDPAMSPELHLASVSDWKSGAWDHARHYTAMEERIVYLESLMTCFCENYDEQAKQLDTLTSTMKSITEERTSYHASVQARLDYIVDSLL